MDMESFRKKKLHRKLRHLAEHGDPMASASLRQNKAGVLKTPSEPKPEGVPTQQYSKLENLALGHDVEKQDLPSPKLDSVKPAFKTKVIGSASDHGARGPFDTISTPVAAGKERPGQHGSAAPETTKHARPGDKALAPGEYAGREAPKASPVRPRAGRMKPFAVDPNYTEPVTASTKFSNAAHTDASPSGTGDSQTRGVQGAKEKTNAPLSTPAASESVPKTVQRPGLNPKYEVAKFGQKGAPSKSFPGKTQAGSSVAPAGDGQQWDGAHSKSLHDYPAGASSAPAGFKSGSGPQKDVVVSHAAARMPHPGRKKRSRRLFGASMGPGKFSEGSPA